MFRVISISLAACFVLTSSAEAQTVKDAVKDHVDKGLDPKKKDKRKKKPSKSRPSTQNGGEPVALELIDDPELVNPNSVKLPIRLFSDYLRLNLKVDTAYRGWLPQQYSSADVDIASYLTWSVAIKGKFFKYITLHRGSYESNGLSSPRTKNAAVAAQVGSLSPKAAKALAYIGFPFLKTWQPVIRYEARAFSTSATPKIPVCIVDHDSSADLMDCPRTESKLRMISSYETLIAAVRYAPSAPSKSIIATKHSKLPPVYLGMGLLSYRKPYQVTIDGDTLEEFLFDGRFRGAGLAMGGNLGGGARRFFADVDLQIGLGEVALTRDFKLNDVTPNDWLIGYVQGNLHTGFHFVVYEGPPTIYFRPSISAGGASFHFVNTSAQEGDQSSSPTLNWDFLWSARAALEFAF